MRLTGPERILFVVEGNGRGEKRCKSQSEIVPAGTISDNGTTEETNRGLALFRTHIQKLVKTAN